MLRRSLCGAVTAALLLTAVPLHADPSSTALIVIHGGGWARGSPAKVVEICDRLVEELAVSCYTPGYTLAGEAPFPAANRDLRAYVGELRDGGHDLVYAIGLSAGGNLAAWLAGRGVVDGVVTWSAPSDLRLRRWPTWTMTRDVRRFAPTNRRRHRASPALLEIHVPILVINSRRELVPLPQARRLFRAATGDRTRKLFAGTKHAFKYRDRALPITIDWLRARLPD